MSLRATTWAWEKTGLSPTEKLVLMAICDCHNTSVDEDGQIYGAFPAQTMIAEKAGISRATVNRTLDSLQLMGLVRRERRTDPHTKKQLSTRYHLAFEDEEEQNKKPQDVDEAESHSETRDDGKAVSHISRSRVSKKADPVSHSYETLTVNNGKEQDARARACEEDTHAPPVITQDIDAADMWLRVCRAMVKKVGWVRWYAWAGRLAVKSLDRSRGKLTLCYVNIDEKTAWVRRTGLKARLADLIIVTATPYVGRPVKLIIEDEVWTGETLAPLPRTDLKEVGT